MLSQDYTSDPVNHNVISLIWDDVGFEWVYNGTSIFVVDYVSLPNLEPLLPDLVPLPPGPVRAA